MVGKRPLERETLSDCPIRGSQLSQRESQGRYRASAVNYNLTFDKRKTTSPPLARWGCCLQKGLERREVEKRIYGVERLRLTASASFLVIEYPTVLNMN